MLSDKSTVLAIGFAFEGEVKNDVIVVATSLRAKLTGLFARNRDLIICCNVAVINLLTRSLAQPEATSFNGRAFRYEPIVRIILTALS